MKGLRASMIAAVLALAAGPGAAQQVTPLELPIGAKETASLVEDPGAYRMPVGRIGVQDQPMIDLEGRVTIRAWLVPADRSDTLALMRAIRPQLAAAGYAPRFECAASACGGFDFRFNTRVLPPPAMEVDLTDFRYIAAERMGETPAHLAILVSRSPRGGHVQAVEVFASTADAGPLAQPLPAPEAAAEPSAPAPVGDLAQELARAGHVALNGVDFATGARTLDADAIAALAPLADMLRANPTITLVLVGHTDNAGGLAQNVALSRARAAAVRDSLIQTHGIAPARLEAEGVGYLAPRATNATEEGRALNRRVEAVQRQP